jgi:hypothetical protein
MVFWPATDGLTKVIVPGKSPIEAGRRLCHIALRDCAMHQRFCLSCSAEALPGLAYCMYCEPQAKRLQLQEQERVEEQIERLELERMLSR